MSLKSFISGLMSKGHAPDPNEGAFSEKRRTKRLDVTEHESLLIRLLSSADEKTGRVIVGQIQNVGLRGCRAVIDRSQAQQLKAGQSLSASLDVDRVPIPLLVEIVRVSGSEVALRFRPPFPKELEQLEKFLEPRHLGLSLREIDPTSLQQEQNKSLRWFQGLNETNLFSWVDPQSQAIIQQQLIFLERVVEWKRGEAVKTGRVKNESSSTGYGWVQSDLLDFDTIPDQALLGQVRVMVAASRIDERVKKEFLAHLK